MIKSDKKTVGIKFLHESSGEERTVFLSQAEIADEVADYAFEKLSCNCDPVGETNVIECGCEDYLEGFYLADEQGIMTDDVKLTASEAVYGVYRG